MIIKKTFSGQNIYSIKYPQYEPKLKEKVANAVRDFFCIENIGCYDIENLALYLKYLGYKPKIRECFPSEKQYLCSLRNKFILLDDLLIDITFKEHFEICRPTSRYRLFLNTIPFIFIGTISDLETYVDTMSKQIHLSFYENELLLPPWRRKEALLSKWFPKTFQDYE